MKYGNEYFTYTTLAPLSTATKLCDFFFIIAALSGQFLANLSGLFSL